MKRQFLGFSILVALTVCLCGNFMGCANTATGDSPTTTYKLTYDGNANSSGTTPADDTAYTSGATVTVLGNTGILAKSGAVFTNWNTSADGSGTTYAPGKTFAISANTTLYAQWVVPSVSSTAVSTISANAVASSGATTTPSDLDSVASSIKAIDSTDTVISDLSTSISSLSPTASSSMIANALNRIIPMNASSRATMARSLSSKIKDAASKITTDAKDFPSKKAMTESIDLSGETLSTYVTLTTAVADGSVSVTTTDSKALDTSKFSNLKFGAAQANLNIKLDCKNLPASSAIKYFSFETKALGSGSIETTSGGGKVVYAYADSSFLALSYVNSSGVGGKILISATVSQSKTITDSSSATNYIPDGTVTISVYNDSNTKIYTKTWTDMNTLITDFKNATSAGTTTP